MYCILAICQTLYIYYLIKFNKLMPEKSSWKIYECITFSSGCLRYYTIFPVCRYTLEYYDNCLLSTAHEITTGLVAVSIHFGMNSSIYFFLIIVFPKLDGSFIKTLLRPQLGDEELKPVIKNNTITFTDSD